MVACPMCEEESIIAVESGGEPPPSWTCPSCGAAPREQGAAPRADKPVASCWLCEGREFYLQKDFNRQLGLFIVLVSAGLIFLVMLTKGHLLGIALLCAVALVDFAIYHRLPTVTVCYLCHSIYRGFPQNSEHKGFYLGDEERYKQLRREWLKDSF